jgi:calcium-dependent protein kinase
MWAEIGIRKQFDHPNIMRLYGNFEDKDHMYMASELCNGGELFDVIQKAGHLPESTCKYLFKQALGAVSYLHKLKICHRDMKPENLMLARKTDDLKTTQLKLLDFGTAKCFASHPMYTKVCTLHYVAPEVLKNKICEYTEKVDIWSCGVMLYFMLCGWVPFHHADDIALMKLVKKAKYVFIPSDVWDEVSQDAKNHVSALMCLKVSDRLSADEAFEHDWFKRDEGAVGSKSNCLDASELLRCIMGYQMKSQLKQVALQIICRHLEDESVKPLRQMWQSLDTSNQGRVGVDTLMKMDARPNVLQGIRQVLASMAKSGEIEYTEFLAATVRPHQYLKQDICRAAFHTLDVDEDGILTAADLNSLLAEEDDEELPPAEPESPKSPKVRRSVRVSRTSKAFNRASSEAAFAVQPSMKELKEETSEADFVKMTKGFSSSGKLNFEEFMLLMAEDETKCITATSRRDHGRHNRRSIVPNMKVGKPQEISNLIKVSNRTSVRATPIVQDEFMSSNDDSDSDRRESMDA